MNTLHIQAKVSQLEVTRFDTLHIFEGVPSDFYPWFSGLSPSALYNCSLPCRKRAGLKTPEVKWMSIKRWTTTTPMGIDLPPGVYFSIKRFEEYISNPDPKFEKTEYVLLMFPYGNVWSQIEPGVPITEEWMWTEFEGILMLERLMRKDAAYPIEGYFKAAREFMVKNPDQIGIHLKRQKKKK
jgi:hypothetical protein